MLQSVLIDVQEESAVGECRRCANRFADDLLFSEDTKSQIALVVSEMASNLNKHGQSGRVIISADFDQTQPTLDIYALDSGPGMNDVSLCMKDGYSSVGTVGGGLGATHRISHEFDIFSTPDSGTVLFSRFYPEVRVPSHYVVASINIPYPGETVSGDGFAWEPSVDKSKFILVDGLGHGIEAGEASARAIQRFRESKVDSPSELLEDIHRSLIKTRGAAVAIAFIDHERGILKFTSIGNIIGHIWRSDKVLSLVASDGIVGYNARRFQVTEYPWTPGSMLLLQSDGLSRPRFENYPELIYRHPGLVAGLFMRDGRRGRDDASILIFKDNFEQRPRR